MAHLDAAQRRKLPASQFALPKQRKLPIENLGHVQAAFGRASMMHNRGELDEAQYKKVRRRIQRRKDELQGKRKPARRAAPAAKKTHAKRRVRRVASNPTPQTKIVKVIGANPMPARTNPGRKKKASTMRKRRSTKRRVSAAQRRAAIKNLRKARAAKRGGKRGGKRRARRNPESRAKRSRAAKLGHRRQRRAAPKRRTRTRRTRRTRARRNPYRLGSPGARRFAKEHRRSSRTGRYTKYGRKYGYARKPGTPTHMHHGPSAVFKVRSNPTGMVGTVVGGIIFGGIGFAIAEVADRLWATRAGQTNSAGQTITDKTAATGQAAADLIAQFSWARTGVSAGIGFLGVAGGMALRAGSWGRLGLVGAGLGAAVKAGADLLMKKAIPALLGSSSPTGSRLFPGEVAVFQAQANNQLPSVVLSSMSGVGSCGENCGCAKCTQIRDLTQQVMALRGGNPAPAATPSVPNASRPVTGESVTGRLLSMKPVAAPMRNGITAIR